MRVFLFVAGLVLVGCAGGAGLERPAQVARVGDGIWMKGDLHVHSRHSKDSTNNPVAKIIALAESAGLDYLLISDHDNHVDGDVARHTWSDPELRSNSVLLLYGADWTPHRGHGTAISDRPYDHQALYDARDRRDVAIGRVKRRLGIHLSANHPGGSDNFGFSYDLVDSVEVWNSAIWARNRNALEIWDDMLKSGRRLTGRGGSDSHHGYPDTPAQKTANSHEAPANNVGTPTTWVFGTSRTSAAVVAALTKGRVSVSANPYAPRVEFYADVDQDGAMDLMMGDNAVSPGKPVTFRVVLAGNAVSGAPYAVSVVKDGAPFGRYEARGPEARVEFTDTPSREGRTYYRVQVEGPPTSYPQVPGSVALSGNMLGLSNPIYFNFGAIK